MAGTHVHMIFQTGVRSEALAPSLHFAFSEVAGLAGVALAEALRERHPEMGWSCSVLPLPDPVIVPTEVIRQLEGYPWQAGPEAVTPDAEGVAMMRVLTGGVPGAMPEGPVQIMEVAGPVRLLICTPAEGDDLVARIAFEVDDMTGEEIAHATWWLRATPGVIDLVLLPGLGKKGRPVTRIDLLADPMRLDAVGNAVFAQTTTLGFRQEIVQRRRLARWPEIADGLRRKRALRPDGSVTVKAEADDIAGLPTLQARRKAARG